MQQVNLREIVGDVGGGLAAIYLLKNYWPLQDSVFAEILGATAAGMLFNGLFIGTQAPIIMLLHAIVGGLISYIAFPYLEGQLPKQQQ